MTDTPVPTAPGPQSGVHLLAGGAAILGCFMLAALAFDDITTDSATTFPLEYGCLVLCAACYLFISVGLVLKGNRVLGLVSLMALFGAVWGQRRIGPGTVPSLQPEYLATLAGMLWLLVLSAMLAVMGFRRLRR